MTFLNRHKKVLIPSNYRGRNENFDFLKGFLIFLVIIGHTIKGSYYIDPVKKFIYFFHMPLFLAVNGYFTKNNLITQPSPKILLKLWHRFILPFTIALVVFAFIEYNGTDATFSLQSIPRLILHPFYHLWYIPAVILFTFYTKIIAAMKNTTLAFLFFAICLTILYEIIGGGNSFNKVGYLRAIGDLRFYCYYTYFLFGYILANNQRIFDFIEIAIFLFVIFLIAHYYTDIVWLAGLLKILSNLCIILIASYICNFMQPLNSVLFRIIGLNSLPIYLWHVLPLFFLKKLPLPLGLYYLYSVSAIFFLICIIFIFNNKYHILNRCIYGTARIFPDDLKYKNEQ